MIVRTMTQLQIWQNGLEALARELGPVGMVRFLQQFETGRGDYSRERHEWLDKYDVESIVKRIEQRRKEQQREELLDLETAG